MADLVAENSIPRVDIKNIEDLNAVLVDRKFGRPEDFIEIYILDLKDNVLASIPNYKDFKIVIDQKSIIYLKGMELDFDGTIQGKGFVFKNPLATSTCGCGESFSVT